jgi:hypothetical protein
MIPLQAEQNTAQVFRAYQKLDALDIEGFVSYLTDEITFTLGKEAEGIGKIQLKIALNRLFYGVVKISHEFYTVYETGNMVVSETLITCRKTNGSQTSFSGVIFLKMERERIMVMKLYMDFTRLIV